MNIDEMTQRLLETNRKKEKLASQIRKLDNTLSDASLRNYLGETDRNSIQILKASLIRVLKGSQMGLDNEMLYWKLQLLDNGGSRETLSNGTSSSDHSIDELTVLDGGENIVDLDLRDNERVSSIKK